MIELDKAYSPANTEAKLYAIWEQQGYFTAPIREGRKPFVIMIPPPNVTGILHIGHVLNLAVQDILVRWHRMLGEDALWLPGMDHAGMATQVRVEKDLESRGIHRNDLGRERMIETINQWVDKHGGIILSQIRKLGASCDWSRERFTFDEGFTRAVQTIFVHLYNKGLIYRGKRIVHWDPVSQTALSDEQVEYKSVSSHLWHFRYPLTDGSGQLVVATTRPETMLGDTAVAVHPEDERYKSMHGKTITLPLVGRIIPIVSDEYVDREFGTGCVKVTPSHDPNDFEIAKRHNLEFITVIAVDGRMNDKVPEQYRGLKREEARKMVVQHLEEQGYLEKIEPYSHSVGHNERNNAVIEPLLSEQWFVSMKELARPAIESLRDGRVRFHPKHWEKTFFHWMDNVQDWCISRQVWYGHRIPLWTVQQTGEVICSIEDPRNDPKYSGMTLVQDPDVVDTWFSSWLWTFGTLGWPSKTPDLEHFHPTSVLVTAPEIIFLWVARMMMASEEVMQVEPFRDVYFHGIVRDQKGRKMSKSLGNSPDPLDIIAEYGADALRFTMVSLTPHGGDVRFGADMCDYGRNFANKIWNASRFLLMNLPADRQMFEFPRVERIDAAADELMDRWILSAFHSTAEEMNDNLGDFRFAESTRRIYSFIWNDFCDWYLELIKTRLQSSDPRVRDASLRTALSVLEGALRLLHPFMPFITEELYQTLRRISPITCTEESIMFADYPQPIAAQIQPGVEEEFGLLQDIVGAIRNIRGELQIQKSVKMNVIWRGGGSGQADFLNQFTPFIVRLAGLAKFESVSVKPAGCASAVVRGVEVFIPLSGLIDPAAELARLAKELERLSKLVSGAEARLSNQQFVSSAKPEIVEAERQKLSDLQNSLSKVQLYLAEVKALSSNP